MAVHQLNYLSSQKYYIERADAYAEMDLDVIIGNSMGGLVTYQLSLLYQKPDLVQSSVSSTKYIYKVYQLVAKQQSFCRLLSGIRIK